MIACAAGWPSTTPLGKGPQVQAEAEARQAWRDTVADAAGPKKPKKSVAAALAQSEKATPTPGVVDAGVVDASATGLALADAGADAPVLPSGKLAGLYSGSDVTRLTLPGGTAAPEQKDPNAKTRVSENANGSLSVVPVDSSNGNDICTLKATPSGSGRSQFSFAANQACFQFGSVTATVDSGTLSFSGKHMDMAIKATVSPPGAPGSAALEYEFSGDRP